MPSIIQNQYKAKKNIRQLFFFDKSFIAKYYLFSLPIFCFIVGENIPSKVVTASQRKQIEASSRPVNGFKRGDYRFVHLAKTC